MTLNFSGMDRSEMTIRIVGLSSPEASDPRMGGTVESRLQAVAELTAEAWRLAGRSFPIYTRATMPIARGTLTDHAPST